MRPVFRALGEMCKAASILVASSSLLLATASVAHAGNGNSPHSFRIIDRQGKLVGYPLTDNVVVREVNGAWVTFYVNPGTGIFDSRAIYVYYATTDCSGIQYLTRYSNFSEGTRVGSTLYYPIDAQEVTPRSLKVVYGNGTEGLCSAAPNVPGTFGVAAAVDVDSFGLQLPFRAVP